MHQADEAYRRGRIGRRAEMLLGPAARASPRQASVDCRAKACCSICRSALCRNPGTDVPLIVNHEIVTAPSASVVAVLRQETAGRKPAAKALAVLADPVFNGGRSRASPRRCKTSRALAVRCGRRPGFCEAAVQPHRSRGDRALAGSGATLKALGFRRQPRDRDEAGSGRLSDRAFRHPQPAQQRAPGAVRRRACRWWIAADARRTDFCGSIDIYNLRLGADLVVLSACRTALGGEIKGEGLIGLTRGFLYAGAPRVVATLWEIDDRTTAEAMKRFYEGMLGARRAAGGGVACGADRDVENQGLGSAVLLGGVHAGRRMAVESDGNGRTGTRIALRRAAPSGRSGRSRRRPSTDCWPRSAPIAILPATATSRSAATWSVSSSGAAAPRRTSTPTRPSTVRAERSRRRGDPRCRNLLHRDCADARSRDEPRPSGRRALWRKRRSPARAGPNPKTIRTAAWSACDGAWSQLSPETRNLILHYYQGDKGDKIRNRKGLIELFGISGQHVAHAGACGFANGFNCAAENCVQRPAGDVM